MARIAEVGFTVRSNSQKTLTISQASSSRPRLGVISGYVFRVIREQHGYTQEEFADRLAVSSDTIAGWESGRRPLTALPIGQMFAHRHRLMRMGTAPALLRILECAFEADIVLAGALDESAASRCSPLGSMVMQRDLVEVLVWPLCGVAPKAVRDLPVPRRSRRGPAPAGPELAPVDRARFFACMRQAAEEARGAEEFLMRRQALYLAGYDDRAETQDWLAHQQRKEKPSSRLNAWLNSRSVAMVSARHGDRDHMCHFIDRGLSDEDGAVANLNYWAYWIGELPNLEVSDDFIAAGTPSPWSGDRLLAHLAGGLEPEYGFVELNIHTAWSLLQVRPGLLRSGSAARALRDRLPVMLDSKELSPRGRRELDSIRYAIRLAEA
ncbi:helix-turn-helix domain-containing protein [Kitasatospora sp. NPDC094028]